MKKWWSLLVALLFVFAYSACDFGEGEEDAAGGEVVEETIGGEVTPQDLTGECTPGDSAGYFYVLIKDDWTQNSALDPNACTAGNPGADIDFVELQNTDGTDTKGYAVVDSFVEGDTNCPNDKADPTAGTIGEWDAVVGPDEYSGYLSLNGGELIVHFEDNQGSVEILCGDIIHIVEVFNEDKPEQTEEYYTVDIGLNTDGPWAGLGEEGRGESFLDVSWTW